MGVVAAGKKKNLNKKAVIFSAARAPSQTTAAMEDDQDFAAFSIVAKEQVDHPAPIKPAVSVKERAAYGSSLESQLNSAWATWRLLATLCPHHPTPRLAARPYHPTPRFLATRPPSSHAEVKDQAAADALADNANYPSRVLKLDVVRELVSVAWTENNLRGRWVKLGKALQGVYKNRDDFELDRGRLAHIVLQVRSGHEQHVMDGYPRNLAGLKGDKDIKARRCAMQFVKRVLETLKHHTCPSAQTKSTEATAAAEQAKKDVAARKSPVQDVGDAKENEEVDDEDVVKSSKKLKAAQQANDAALPDSDEDEGNVNVVKGAAKRAREFPSSEHTELRKELYKAAQHLEDADPEEAWDQDQKDAFEVLVRLTLKCVGEDGSCNCARE